MPGVPSSRGCDECRRRKKRCEAEDATPQCSQCRRMGIPCVGRGQQRFKFVDESRQLAVRNRETTTSPSIESGSSDHGLLIGRPMYDLANQLTRLIAAFASKIDASADINIQLPWNFGDFLSDIPRRLGTNDALDAAAQALVTSYTHFVAGDATATPDVLIAHSNALSALRRCLDDPVVAYSSETLCSTMVLLIVQTLPGINGNAALRSHSIGAAQVLKGRGYTGPKDEFEAKLLLSLRGPVIIDGLINSEISMTPAQWRDLVYNPIDTDTMDGQMMKCFAQLPDLMRRGRQALKTPTFSFSDLADIQRGMHTLRESFAPHLKGLRERWQETDSSIAMLYPEFMRSKAIRGIMHAHFSRSYGMALACEIILNCMLAAIQGNDAPAALSEESSSLSDEVLHLAGIVNQYRPLGTLYMVVGLLAAWVGAVDPARKAVAKKWLIDYHTDTQGPSNIPLTFLKRFELLCYLG